MLLIEFRDTHKVSQDGKYTQGDLMKIIKKMVARRNISCDSNEEISNYIFNCFSLNVIEVNCVFKISAISELLISGVALPASNACAIA